MAILRKANDAVMSAAQDTEQVGIRAEWGYCTTVGGVWVGLALHFRSAGWVSDAVQLPRSR